MPFSFIAALSRTRRCRNYLNLFALVAVMGLFSSAPAAEGDAPIDLYVDTPPTATAGWATPVTIHLHLASFTSPSYTGTFRYTSTDPAALLPAPVTLTSSLLLSYTVAVKFFTPGVHTVTVTDTTSPSVPPVSATVTVGAELPVTPDTLLVTNTLDYDDGGCTANDCTLREAIKYAVDYDRIGFAPDVSGTIVVGSVLPVINKNLTINGPGADVLAISGGGRSAILGITGGYPAINNLSFVKGFSNAPGGAVTINGGTPSFNRCVFGGSAELGNRSMNAGGAVYMSNFGATFNDCTFSHNRAVAGGGALMASNASVNMWNCTLTANSSDLGLGGAITINHPSAPRDVALVNCTVSGNSIRGGSVHGRGGGIYATPLARLRLLNTIVAGNTATVASPDIEATLSTATYHGNNLIGDATGVTGIDTANGDRAGVDWKTILANDGTAPTLAYNGGPLPTILLAPGSPARDAGNDIVYLSSPPFDQRGAGYSRKQDDHIDIGAIEMQNHRPVAAPQNVVAYPNVAKTITLAATDSDGDPLTYRLARRPAAGVRLYNGASTSSQLIGSGVALPFKLATNQITYLAPASFTGADSFMFTVHDGATASETATISLNVVAPVPPGIAITSPLANQQFNNAALTGITGTITDNSPEQLGINKVQLYFFRANPAGAGLQYFTGGAWATYANSTAAIAASATLPTSIGGNATQGFTWTCTGGLPAGLLPSGAYTVRAVAVGNDGISSAPATAIIKVATAPSVTIAHPLANQQFTGAAVTALDGAVTDNNANAVGINRVELYFYRTNPAGGYQYWTGAAWTSFANFTAATAGGARLRPTISDGAWIYNGLPTGLLGSGTYFVRVQAFSNAGLASPVVTSSFKVLNGPPTVAFLHPTANQALGAAPLAVIDGSVTDNSPDQVGINKVVLNLYRPNTGGAGFQYWTGTSWTYFASSTAAVAGGGALATELTGSNAWTCTAPLPATLAAGTYYLRAYAVDNSAATGPVASRAFTSSGGPATISALSTTSGLSTATATTAGITLTFATSLDPASAANVELYTVAINGQSVAVEGAAYANGKVTLMVGSLHSGDQVQAAWYGLRTASGHTLQGATGILAAK